jgi:alanine racemase
MRDEDAVRPAAAEMDMEALARNYRAVARRVGPETKIIASVKADAYGHGAVACAERLVAEGAFALATGDLGEATAMRAAGITAPILMFAGVLPSGIPTLLRHGFIPTVYDMDGVDAAANATERDAPIYIKVDCGLGRLGVDLDEAPEFVAWAAARPGVRVEGLYTHLPFADAAGRDWSAANLTGFDALVARLDGAGIRVPVTQAMASSAVLAGLEDTCNAVCVGHLLYGLSPMAPGEADLDGFSPVLATVRARLIHVAHHPIGRDVIIAARYGIGNAMLTGVVPLGVHHGMRAAAPGQTAEVLFRGRRAPVLSVSLEHTTLDLTGADDPKVGEVVTAIGEDGDARIAIEEVAARQGRTPLEVAMTFSRRLPVRDHCPPARDSFPPVRDR